MKKFITIIFLTALTAISFIGCKKTTMKHIRGRWEKVIIDTVTGAQPYGSRQVIREIWDFRDVNYMFVETTWSGQSGYSPGSSLNPYPSVNEKKRRYEIPKRKELHIIDEGPPDYTEYYVINLLNEDYLKISRFENGKNSGDVEFSRAKD